MAKKEREQVKTYVIPPNFVDKMSIAGGRLRFRNLVEAVLITAVVLVPALSFIPMNMTAKIYVIILAGVPLFAIGCIGFNGDSLFQFLHYWIAFRKNKRISRYNPHIKKPDNIREALSQNDEKELPRDRIMKMVSDLTGRTFEVQDQNFDELYADVSMQVRFDDDDTVLSYGFGADQSLSKKERKAQEKRARQLAALGIKNMDELRFDNEKKEFVSAPVETDVDEIEDIARFIEETKRAGGGEVSFEEQLNRMDVSRMIKESEEFEIKESETPIFEILE